MTSATTEDLQTKSTHRDKKQDLPRIERASGHLINYDEICVENVSLKTSVVINESSFPAYESPTRVCADLAIKIEVICDDN